MKLTASNNISMIFQGTVEERNWKIPHLKTLLSLTIYTLTPSNSTHYYLTSSISLFSTETTKKFPAESKTTDNLRMYSVKDKVLLVNSSALISTQKSSFMIRIFTGDWSSYELFTLVISM